MIPMAKELEIWRAPYKRGTYSRHEVIAPRVADPDGADELKLLTPLSEKSLSKFGKSDY